MYELTPTQAQNIVNKMMKDIPYNINIMDRTGVIIGSGNTKRIGTLHHGAVAAINQKETVEIQVDEEFVKKGINSPIEINGEIVGVVGISGVVEETRPFGNLVKSTVILLIEQSVTLEKQNREKNRRNDFFSQLINSDPAYTTEISNQALTYAIHLNKTSQVIYMEFPYGIIEELTSINDFPSFTISNNSICIIIQDPNQLEPIKQFIETSYTDAYISISTMNDTIYDGYRQAKSAMRVLKGLFPYKKMIFYANCEFIAEMSEQQVIDKKTKHLLSKLENHDELIKTLQVFLSKNLNVSEAADQLIIHRNTLNYRLNRIHDITGKDPKNILELVELLFSLINRVE